jgi:outer membrane protein assembly factor BamB
MPHDEHLFTPDEVDEQIDWLERASHAQPPTPTTTTNIRVIQGLHRLYENEQADAYSVDTVRQRLQERGAVPAALPQRARRSGPPRRQQDSGPPPQAYAPAAPARRGLSTRLLAIAAAVLLVVVVSGLVAGLVLVRQHGPVISNHPTVKPGQTVLPSPTDTSTAPPTATPVPLGQQNVYVASDNGVITALNASTGAVRWSYQSMGKLFPNFNSYGEGSEASMAVSGGVLYIGSSAGVEAVDARNGSMLWQYKTDGGSGAPVVSNGIVYGAGASIFALHAKDGTVLWKQAYPSPTTNLVSIAEGVVFVGGDNNPTFAFDASNGNLLWQDTSGGLLWGEAQGSAYYTTEAPGVACCLRAINARNGSQRWTFDQSHEAVPYGFVGNIVYTSSSDNYFYALNATDGSIVWKSADVHPIFTLWAKLFATFFYTSTNDGTIVALNPRDGSQQWTSSTFVNNASWLSPGAEEQGVLYVSYVASYQADGGGIAALSVNNGAMLWKTHIDSIRLLAIEGVTNGALYLNTDDVAPGAVNNITAFSTSDGSQLWQYSQAGLLPGALID